MKKIESLSDEDLINLYKKYSDMADKEFHQLGLDYNLQDTRLVERMEDETGLLALVMTVAYGGGVNFNDAFGTVGIWESTIYRKLMDKNTVPFLKRGPGERGNELVGGYVKDPKVGMHPWVVSFDLNSLYPMLMLQYNMSPETYEGDKRVYITQEMVLNGQFQNEDADSSVCANGVHFTNNRLGIIPEIIDEYYGNRKKIKQEMLRVEQLLENETDPVKKAEYKKEANQLHNSQMAIKIAMNSLYGATANIYFLYYIGEMAEAITTSGQLSIRYAQKSVNEYLNKILKTEDTDYVIYCVDGETTLNVNEKTETISNLYDRMKVSTLDGIKNIQDQNIFVLSYNTKTGKREYKKACAVIKRTAKKGMYKVWIDDKKYVVVSEDHRFIVKRDGAILEVLPKDLLETDTFINIHGYTKNGAYRCTKSAMKREYIV